MRKEKNVGAIQVQKLRKWVWQKKKTKVWILTNFTANWLSIQMNLGYNLGSEDMASYNWTDYVYYNPLKIPQGCIKIHHSP
jgi:hypothetical protein